MPYFPQRKKVVFQARKYGFTLVEILLVTSLISVISVAVYHTLANGLKVWKKSQQVFFEDDAVIFYSKMTHDFYKLVQYSLIPFKGEEDNVSFAAVIRTLADGKIALSPEEYVNQIGRVEYYFDRSKNAVYRRQANYSQALKGKFGPAVIMVDHVISAKFFYCQTTVACQSTANIIPTVVTVVLDFQKDGEIRRVSRNILLPLGK